MYIVDFDQLEESNKSITKQYELLQQERNDLVNHIDEMQRGQLYVIQMSVICDTDVSM